MRAEPREVQPYLRRPVPAPEDAGFGFLKEARHGVGRLTIDGHTGASVVVETDLGPSIRQPTTTLTPATIRALRQVHHVQVTWGGANRALTASLVVQMARLGIPLRSSYLPPGVRHALGSMARLFEAPVPRSPLAREVEATVWRREALLSWTNLGRAGSSTAFSEPVTAALCTRRPALLPFALAQIGAQRSVDLDVIVVCHGFELPQQEQLRLQASTARRIRFVAVAGTTVFGDALNTALTLCDSPILLKVDDDDWYSPFHAVDVCIALRAARSMVAGSAAEFVYLAQIDTTIRRRMGVEMFTNYVAGGTLALDVRQVRELGGFSPVGTAVDRHLFETVLGAGGKVYRTHPFNMVLRRKGSGHTWDPGLDYFLRRGVEQWSGFQIPRAGGGVR